MDISKEYILDFLQQQHVGVVSSIDSSGNPNSATVYFIVDEDYNFYFPTRPGSRKYTNISDNPNVSFTTTDAKGMTTVQLTGVAEEVAETAAIIQMIEKLLNVSTHHIQEVGRWIPPIKQLRDGHFALIKIAPTWMRYGQFNKDTARSDSDNYTIVIGN
jgi:uncharacterized pyridoxamine 5'-phosphate oxidase family protein